MTKSKLDAALEYLDRGWSIIPIKPEGKRPAIKWRDYQDRLPTEEEVVEWWERWPDYDIAIVTGALSGVVVVDCDNEDAMRAAFDAGMRSPIRVKTKRGIHLYFQHPKDGIRRGPRAGVNSRGEDWPRIDGLDFRGDGSYALLPPSNGYRWDLPSALDLEDDTPVWRDWRPELPPAKGDEFSFGRLDLSDITPAQPDEFVSEWDRTAKFVRERFPSTLKIPTGLGNGRNERAMRYLAESIKEGYWADDLCVRGYAFMREFFEEPLPDPEFQATVRSLQDAERRNHPENFDDDGNFILLPTPPSWVEEAEPDAVSEKPRPALIRMEDADAMLEESGTRKYLIEPWLPPATIVQVHGYTGHGKSLFLQYALGALTSGQRYFGPFEIGQPALVLYLDYEMGKATIARRLIEMRDLYGDTQDRLNIWTPFDGREEMNLKTKEGMLRLQGWIKMVEPDVVVIDTIRSAFPGMQENNAEEWSRVNQLAVKMRNVGISVVLVHHSNKPGESGLGREAGSTNQLTVVETQLSITQVYQDEETARVKAGIHDKNTHPERDIGGDDRIWSRLAHKCPPDYVIRMVMEVRYGKVRDWTDLHDPVQWIALAEDTVTGKRIIVSSSSTKQKAKDLALDGKDVTEIAQLLHRPAYTIREWLDLPSS